MPGVFLLLGALLLVCVMLTLRQEATQQWRRYQRGYVAALKQRTEPGESPSFRAGIVQTWVPELRRVDRCQTCHLGIENPAMADAPEPYTAHPGELLDYHPVERFGCTICHEGEGRGTTVAGSHGQLERSQWPLWRGAFIESSCGTCHLGGELDAAPVLSRGRDLFRGYYCSFCHRLGDEGGDVGPDLSSVGSKPIFQFDFRNIEGQQTAANWLMAHFRDPTRVTPGTKMPNYRLSDDDVLALTVYMLSLTGEELPAGYRLEPLILPVEEDVEGIKATSPGHELFLQSCALCHGSNGEGRVRFAPALNNQAWLSIVTDEFIEQSIARGRPGTPMFTWHEDEGGVFSQQRIGELVAFIRSWQRVPSQKLSVGVVAGDPENGQRLYARLCASCHGSEGRGWKGPALNNDAFLAIASDAYMREIVAAAKRRKPVRTCLQDSEAATRLSDAQINDIVSFVRSWESAEPAPPEQDTD